MSEGFVSLQSVVSGLSCFGMAPGAHHDVMLNIQISRSFLLSALACLWHRAIYHPEFDASGSYGRCRSVLQSVPSSRLIVFFRSRKLTSLVARLMGGHSLEGVVYGDGKMLPPHHRPWAPGAGARR